MIAAWTIGDVANLSRTTWLTDIAHTTPIVCAANASSSLPVEKEEEEEEELLHLRPCATTFNAPGMRGKRDINRGQRRLDV